VDKFPIVDNASVLPGLAEKARDRHRGGFGEPRTRARDADFQSSCIRSDYDLPDTAAAAVRAKSMALSETHHGAASGTLRVDRGSLRVKDRLARGLGEAVQRSALSSWLAKFRIFNREAINLAGKRSLHSRELGSDAERVFLIFFVENKHKRRSCRSCVISFVYLVSQIPTGLLDLLLLLSSRWSIGG